MSVQTNFSGLIPAQPAPACAGVFSSRMSGLLDGQPKDEATVAKAFAGLDGIFDLIAARLYTLASMLVGEGEESVRLVEEAIGKAEMATNGDAERARKNSRRALCAAAIEVLAWRAAQSLTAPQSAELGDVCSGDDHDSSGVSLEELERALTGPDRMRVREWLEGLSTSLRTVFVLRAVAGLNPAETAELLRTQGGAQAAGWTEDGVRVWFRRALCSLATQILRAPAAA